MALSRNLGQYEDIRQVLDMALANGGGRYVLDSEKATFRWRQRAYMYRKLLREDLEARRDSLGFSTVTPYDHLLLTLSGTAVILTISAPTGKFETLAGDIIDTTTAPPSREPDDLELEAMKLINDLGA